MKTLRYEAGNDGVAIITLDDPNRPMNVVSPEFIDDIIAVIDKVVADDAIKGAVICSAKPAFMAGADLKFFLASMEAQMTLDEAYAFSQRASIDMHRRMETCGKPIVAAMGGLALGGGFELTLACHYRVVADNPKIALGLPEVTVGLLAGSGGTQRLPRMIGVQQALPLILEGKTVNPMQALELGAIDQVVAADQLLDAAKALVLENPAAVRDWDKPGYQPAEGTDLAALKTAANFEQLKADINRRYQGNYPSPMANLECVFEGIVLPFDEALSYESQRFAELVVSASARNIIRTSFVNKGLADKLFRRPKDFDKAVFNKIGVLGAGLMGSGIAYAAAKAGIEVVLLDSRIELAEKGKNYSETIVNKAVERGRMAPAKAEALLANISPTVSYAELADCQLVIEAVFEDVAIKADVTRQVEAVIAETAIYASNTSTLPISELAKASARPAQFIGLHFFSPVERMPLIEVISGQQTSQQTLAHALDFVGQLRMTPILVNDSRGFYTSRVFQTFIHEGMKMLEEGVAPKLIEAAAKQAGMPIGPLALCDELSIELPWKIVQQSIAAEGDNYQLPCAYQVMKTMVEQVERIGRRAGGGFYDYPAGEDKRIWPGLADLYPVAAEQPDSEQLKKRYLYIQSLETARCYEEGVLTHPADADLGAILGWGFPTYTGGTLSLIDTVGIEPFVNDCLQLSELFGDRFKPSAWLCQRAADNKAFYPCD
jgi:3-hydroxyacyl-CoA dehydrogenase/enoyl-CoA hydratase/3-hydroxybutyryl-CoA epimerase